MTAGSVHTCALTITGGVKCWGNNVNGQLGRGTQSRSEVLPVDVVGLTSGVAQIVAGYSFTCALLDAGGVKCWGYNTAGELGNNSRSTSSVPVDVVGLDSRVVQISAGPSFVCALMETGGVKCWGYGLAGEMGNGKQDFVNSVGQVTGLTSGVAQVDAGDRHACVALHSKEAKCWGFNLSGELGGNTLPGRSSSLTPISVLAGP